MRKNRKDQLYDGCSIHKIWKGHNSEFNLFEKDEKAIYIKYLSKKKIDPSIKMHAYCLMDNHSHEIYTVDNVQAFCSFLRNHHMHYAQYFNKKHKRSGSVGNDRPKTILFESETHEMRCVFYIHANAVRAKLVDNALDWEYSTHRLYALGERTSLNQCIQFPQWYMDLGKTDRERRREYLILFEMYVKLEL